MSFCLFKNGYHDKKYFFNFFPDKLVDIFVKLNNMYFLKTCSYIEILFSFLFHKLFYELLLKKSSSDSFSVKRFLKFCGEI